MQPIQGRSLAPIFASEKAGRVDPARDHVLIGKERHDVGRPNNQGYPIRGILRGDYLYLRNYEPSRWPVGNPETGYPNTDGGPTKTITIEARKNPAMHNYWQWNFGLRGEEELFNIAGDPDCMNDLSSDPKFDRVKLTLRTQMENELREQNDPRMFGNGDIFDNYPFGNPGDHNFYENFVAGKVKHGGWYSAADVDPIDPVDPSVLEK
jgi:hypothetical protein